MQSRPQPLSVTPALRTARETHRHGQQTSPAQGDPGEKSRAFGPRPRRWGAAKEEVARKRGYVPRAAHSAALSSSAQSIRGRTRVGGSGSESGRGPSGSEHPGCWRGGVGQGGAGRGGARGDPAPPSGGGAWSRILWELPTPGVPGWRPDAAVAAARSWGGRSGAAGGAGSPSARSRATGFHPRLAPSVARAPTGEGFSVRTRGPVPGLCFSPWVSFSLVHRP